MGITPNYNLYRTLRHFLVDVIGPESLSPFIENCYEAIHQSIRESPFSLRVPSQTLIMFTTLKRLRETYLELLNTPIAGPIPDDFNRRVALAKLALLKQLIDYTRLRRSPGASGNPIGQETCQWRLLIKFSSISKAISLSPVAIIHPQTE